MIWAKRRVSILTEAPNVWGLWASRQHILCSLIQWFNSVFPTKHLTFQSSLCHKVARRISCQGSNSSSRRTLVVLSIWRVACIHTKWFGKKIDKGKTLVKETTRVLLLVHLIVKLLHNVYLHVFLDFWKFPWHTKCCLCSDVYISRLTRTLSILCLQKKVVPRVSDKKHKLSDFTRPVIYSQTW